MRKSTTESLGEQQKPPAKSGPAAGQSRMKPLLHVAGSTSGAMVNAVRSAAKPSTSTSVVADASWPSCDRRASVSSAAVEPGEITLVLSSQPHASLKMWVTSQVLNRTSSLLGLPSSPRCLPMSQPPTSVHPTGTSTVYETGVVADCEAEYVPGSSWPVLSLPSQISPGEMRATDGAAVSVGVAVGLG